MMLKLLLVGFIPDLHVMLYYRRTPNSMARIVLTLLFEKYESIISLARVLKGFQGWNRVLGAALEGS